MKDKEQHIQTKNGRPGLGRREVVSPAQYFGDRANEVELDARNAGARRPQRGASNVGGKGAATEELVGGEPT